MTLWSRGWGRPKQGRRTGEEGNRMAETRTTANEERRQKLLDQLENPGLTQPEIEKIKLKLDILDSQQ